MANIKATGTIKFFDSKKSYGFITQDNGEKDVFMHISGWKGGETIEEKQGVSFEIIEGKRGLQAINVVPI